MANQIFTIEKGMVFWMDVPGKEQPIPLPGESCVAKKRPYVVLSSAEMNTASNFVHVAPITTKPPYESQWFKVPFKKRDSTCCWINISNLMLVPKKYCTVADYSESHTNVILNNKELMSRLEDVLLKWFGITREVSVDNAPQNNVDTESSTTQPQSINITINIPGLASVKVTTDAEGNANVKEITNISTQEPIVEEVDNIPPLRRGKLSDKQRSLKNQLIEYIRTHSQKFGGDMTDQQIANKLLISLSTVRRYKVEISKAVEVKSTLSTNTGTSSHKVGKTFTSKKRQDIIAFIKKNSRAFGGNMTDKEITDALGVGHCTVSRYKSKIMKSTVSKVSKRNSKIFPDAETEKLFMQYYEQFGPTAAYERFKDICGFKNLQACYNVYFYRKYKRDKVK